MSKLTLNVDKDLIEVAKEEASRRNISLSQLVSNYLRVITSDRPISNDELPPATRALSGLLAGRDVDLEARYRHLEEKHL